MLIAEHRINGILIPPPVNWADINVLATFDNDSIEADIDTDTFQFVNEANALIIQHIEGGKNGTSPGVFEGIPYTITLNDGTNNLPVFDGYITLVEGFRIISPVKCEAKVKRLDSLNDLNDKLEGMTFALLEDQGYIGNSDYFTVPWILEKEFNFAEFAILSVTTFLMTKEFIQQVKEIAAATAQVAALFAGGFPGSGQVAAAALAVALLIIQIAYAAIMLTLLYNLWKEIFEQIFSPIFKNKGLTFQKAAEKIFGFAGYSFSTTIQNFDKYIYFPSKTQNVDKKTFISLHPKKDSGIPNTIDYGYRAIEMVDLFKNMFEAKLYIDIPNKAVRLIPLNDPFWKQQTQYNAPDVLNETKVYNTDDMRSTTIVSFATDPSDYWTLENYKGTSYEVSVVPITQTNPTCRTIKGLDQIRFQVALGTRKTKLTDLETALYKVAQIIDRTYGKLSSLFGGQPSNFASQIKSRVKYLKKGTHYHAVPKVLYLDANGLMPDNHLDKLSAKALWNGYINYRSLVANFWTNQKLVVKEFKLPFTFANFLIASKNKFFTLSDGRQAEFNSIKWQYDGDYAICDFKIAEIYDRNLKEVAIEPE